MYETVTAKNLEIGMDLHGLGKVVEVEMVTDAWRKLRAVVRFDSGRKLIFFPNRKLYAKIGKKKEPSKELDESSSLYQRILRRLRQ